MRYILAIVLFLIPAMAIAGIDIAGHIKKQNGFGGSVSITGGIGNGGPPPTGDILMTDGSSLILQTDGASFICRAGGC
jgi:hypothetical protein